MTGTWPFVGREAQLEQLRGLLAGTASSAGLVVSGAAGLGKTRLLAEARSTAEAARSHAVSLAATAATQDLPFGMFSTLLPRDRSTPRDLLGSDRLDLLLATADRLCAQAGKRRLVLLVDDVNFADQGSVALIHHLAMQRQAVLLLAVRTGEQLPDALHLLWRQGSLEWIELAALLSEEVTTLLEKALGGAIESRSALRLAEASGGNPLYLRELVRAGQAQGALACEGGVWSLSRLPQLPTPLADILRERLRGLSAAEREVVALVGSGEPVELGLVVAVLGAQAVERAEAQGLVSLVTAERRAYLRLAHPLYGELLRGEPGQLRLLRLRRELAEAMVATGLRRRGDVLRLALAQADGVLDVDAGIQLEGIREASAAFDHDLVLRLGRAAQQAGGGFEAGHAIAEAYAWKGDGHRAEEAFAALQSQAGDDAQRGIAARNRAGNLFFGLGRTRAAYQVIEEACQTIGDPHWTAELGLLRAGIAICSGHAMQALEFGALVLGDGGTERLELHQMPGLVSTLTALGNTEAAIMAGEAAVAPLEHASREYPYLIATTKVALSEAYMLHGELAKAQELATSGYREALNGCADGLRGQWALAAGRAAVATGRLATAARSCREAALLLGQHGTLLGPCGRIEALGWLAVAQAIRGDVSGARQALADAQATHCEDAFVVATGLGRTWLAAAQGDLPEARRVAHTVAQEAAELGDGAYEALAWHAVTRLGGQAHERLTELAAMCPSPMHDAYACHAQALANADAAGLESAVEQFDRLGATLLAAEASAAAAALYERLGSKGNAIVASLRTQARLEACALKHSPALSALAVGAIPELTQRERETVDLALSGMSNAAIAARLVLSVRTVESHLHNAYTKLGIGSREELTRLLSERG
ncbi:LuxR C-terminal-related transcriptional regulator [Rhizocola hellebori]|uniref:LuxR C-terminal-related transcriptional regulator n=1 Tax=Rhizocola hellebori TaxID=1392758 RepID=UPI00194450C7|nr:LuxR family transcriptional regulator [Rhizocola hellebori]